MNRIGETIRNPPHVPVVDPLAADHLAASGFRDPTLRKNLIVSYLTATHKEQSKSTVVAQGGTQATAPDLLPLGRCKAITLRQTPYQAELYPLWPFNNQYKTKISIASCRQGKTLRSVFVGLSCCVQLLTETKSARGSCVTLAGAES